MPPLFLSSLILPHSHPLSRNPRPLLTTTTTTNTIALHHQFSATPPLNVTNPWTFSLPSTMLFLSPVPIPSQSNPNPNSIRPLAPSQRLPSYRFPPLPLPTTKCSSLLMQTRSLGTAGIALLLKAAAIAMLISVLPPDEVNMNGYQSLLTLYYQRVYTIYLGRPPFTPFEPCATYCSHCSSSRSSSSSSSTSPYTSDTPLFYYIWSSVSLACFCYLCLYLYLYLYRYLYSSPSSSSILGVTFQSTCTCTSADICPGDFVPLLSLPLPCLSLDATPRQLLRFRYPCIHSTTIVNVNENISEFTLKQPSLRKSKSLRSSQETRPGAQNLPNIRIHFIRVTP
ncbi:hypothetical protein D9758_014953 [Tetrapyrgos nigripes]|uniref:Uncharacterized protein n=1 Tax=Tetrapyrgos nigripes TaxID=182062 RepID=A0A8H5FMT1_9AGAR|nr:hypothetical protein D9758_014953 [Tetrapyrgos nigripes]